MAFDTSVFHRFQNTIESPQNALMRGLEVQRAQQGNALQAFQFQQAQRQAQAAEQENALRARFATPENRPGDGVGPTQDAGYDFNGYATALARIDPIRALQMKASLQEKKPALMNVGAGGAIFDPNTRKQVFQAPFKPEAPALPDIAKLQGYRDSLPQGDPRRREVDAIIGKMQTHAPGVSVSYGAPVAGVDAEGKPIFFQPGKNGGAPMIVPGVAPPKREPPAALQEKLAQNAVTLQKIDKALEQVNAYPGAFGLQNIVGDSAMQRVDPKGVEVRAMVADIGGQKIHDRSGAAVTVGETARLKPYIPNVNDTPDTVKKKLTMFRNEYAAMQQAINSGASVQQAAAKGGAAPAANPGGWKIEKVQ